MVRLKSKEEGRIGGDGYVLVIVLGVLVLVSALSADLLKRTRLNTSILRNSIEIMEARQLTGGAISLGITELARDTGSPDESGSLPYIDVQIDGYDLTVEVEDECGKLDLNTVNEEILENLMEELDFDSGDASEIAELIVSQYSTKHRRRLEVDQSEEVKEFSRSVDDLLLLDEIDNSVVNRLAPYVTTFCVHEKISVWSAPRQVLTSLPGANKSAIDRFVEDRQNLSRSEYERQFGVLGSLVNPEWLSNRRGPIYTVRSSLKTKSGQVFQQKKLIWLEAGERSGFAVLRNGYPRQREDHDL